MKKYTTKVTIGNRTIHTSKSEKWPYLAVRNAERSLVQEIYKKAGLYAKRGGVTALKEGEATTLAMNVKILIHCTMNSRAPKRAPKIIAAEKAARVIRRRQDAAEYAEREKQQELEQIQRRARIRNQIDHAFKSDSEPGSESVSK